LRRRFATLRVTPLVVIALAVALLLIVSPLAVTSDFYSRASLSTLTPLIGIMVIVSIGQAFVISTGGIDLSVPATITLIGSIVLKSSQGHDNRLVGTLLLCLGACVAIGLVNGLLVEGLGLNSLVVTLAVGQLVAGLTRLYRGEVLAFTRVPPRLVSAASANVAGVSYLLIVGLGIALVATAFLHRVVSGRRLVASSAAPRAAFLVGLRSKGYRIAAYVIASVMYGIGGVLAAAQIGTPDLTLGDPYLLTPIVAIVIGGAVLSGGRVSPLATLLGAVFVTVLDYDLRVRGYTAGTRLIVQGCIIAFGLAFVFAVGNYARLPTWLRRRDADGAAESTLV
jgi:ribose transport system permease protein